MAIPIRQAATQGLSLSPIRANFQNVPRNPVLFLSSSPGEKDLQDVQSQNAAINGEVWSRYLM